MKANRTKSAATLAAFLSITPISQGHAAGHSFTALEDLLPERRKQVAEQVDEMTKNINIDWDSLVIGVDENGQIVILPKDDADLQAVAKPSSFDVGAVRKEATE